LVTLVIGSDAVCSDGYRGEVRAVVVDPAARTVTHVVVEPKGRLGLARLVPLDLVGTAPGQIRLRCTEAEFKSLAAAEETLAEFVPGYPVPVQLLPPGWRAAGGLTVEGGRPARDSSRSWLTWQVTAAPVAVHRHDSAVIASDQAACSAVPQVTTRSRAALAATAPASSPAVSPSPGGRRSRAALAGMACRRLASAMVAGPDRCPAVIAALAVSSDWHPPVIA